jgi:hypothetical protein
LPVGNKKVLDKKAVKPGNGIAITAVNFFGVRS